MTEDRPEQHAGSDGYLSLKEAAEYLRCSTRSIRRHIECRSLPHYCFPSANGGERGALRFRKRELDRWARRFRQHAPALDN